MRRAHWLKPLQSQSFPSELVVFDTETVERPIDAVTVEHVLAFGWAMRCRVLKNGKWSKPEWFRFEDNHHFWDWLEQRCRPKAPIYAYCHNANFDWQVTAMCQTLPVMGWKCESAIIEDPPNYFCWRKGTKTLKLLDSFNYFYASVAALGEKLGLPKLEMPDTWSDRETGDAYCRRDCEIIMAMLQQWIAWLREHELGGLRISLAAQSMAAYKYRFMENDIFIDDNEQSHELARAAYYGGRTEAWTIGEIVYNVYDLDVNSMYPHVMRGNEFPTRLHGVYKRVTHAELSSWLDKYAVVAEVTLHTNEPCYPQRDGGRLTFPVGTFQTYLTSPELRHALEHDHIVSCSLAAVYDKAILFRAYVDEMYGLRREFIHAGDDVAVYYTKKLINSFYGKWGQRGSHEEIIGYTDDLSLRVEDEVDLDTGERYRIRYIAGVIMRRTISGESQYSHPAICAHVTAYARLLLWRLACEADIDNVHYMDTDSLHVSYEGMQNLRHHLSGDELGGLKVEKQIARAIYYGAKDYELDGVRRMKGIRAKAVQIGAATFEQEQWGSLRGACRDAWTGGPLVRRIRKSYTREYHKGTVTATGRVLPLWRSPRKPG